MMTPRRYGPVLVLASAVALSACGGGSHPHRAIRHQVHPMANGAAPTAVGAKAAAPVHHAPEYVYSPIGKRDPFRSPFADLRTAPEETQSSRHLTPLQRWGLEQLTLKATITGTSSPMAMVVDPDGRGWVVRRGTLIGKHWGKVTAITKDCIVIAQQVRDASQAVSTVKQEKCLPKKKQNLDFQDQFD